MPSLNKSEQIGRLTRDVELRTTGSGTVIGTFGLANNERKKNQQTGQWENGDPMFIDVVMFGGLAEHNAAVLRKGSEVLVVGRLALDQWDDKTTGAKRSKHKIIADIVTAIAWHGATQKPTGGGGQPSEPAAPVEDDASIPF